MSTENTESGKKRLLQDLFPAHRPSDWKRYSVFWGAKNKWLFDRTNAQFPVRKTVETVPEDCHFVFLYSKAHNRYPANYFMPCSSGERTVGCYILPDKGLQNGDEKPFRFNFKTYIIFQFLIPLPYNSEDNEMLLFRGVVDPLDIDNYHLIKERWRKK